MMSVLLSVLPLTDTAGELGTGFATRTANPPLIWAPNDVTIPQQEVPLQVFSNNADYTASTSGQHQENSLVTECPAVVQDQTSEDLLTAMKNSSKNCTVHNGSANCSNLGLSSVPQNLPVDIFSLDLYNNCLVELPNCIFAHYSNLHYLNLSGNKISSLQNLAFKKLGQLRGLRIKNNLLPPNSSFYPSDIFCPLKNLTHLEISFDVNNTTRRHRQYPDHALSCLRNLESLSIDGFDIRYEKKPFGDGFKNLTKLKNLMFGGDGGFCNMKSLPNNTFENFKNVENLSLSKCKIYGNHISPVAFHPLRKLRKLDLSHNERISIPLLTNIFKSLQKLENLTELDISSVTIPFSVGQCLDVSTVQYFPPNLKYLTAANNRIEAVDPEVLEKLSPSLQTLNLSDNPLTLGSYVQHLHKMTNLTKLLLNGIINSLPLPKFYPYSPHQMTLNSTNCTNILVSKANLTITLPPKLERVEMINFGLNYDLTELHINESNSLRVLIIKENRFPRLEGKITGLGCLRTLDISNCGVNHISLTFFDTLTSLETLRLDSNNLGDFLHDLRNKKVFSELKDLRSLNLSNNGIYSLPVTIFKFLSSLNKLYLKKNRLTLFNMDLTHIRYLSHLDLSETSVPTLPKHTQLYFDDLIKAGKKVSICMEFTLICCECDNLHFLQWMTRSKAFTKPLKNYNCSYNKFKVLPIFDDYEETISILKRKCASNVTIFLIVGSITTAVSCLIISAISYRLRWNIRYLYYAAYLHFKGTSNPRESTYEFDAFVCYAAKDARFAEGTLDRELSKRGLKIFLHGRDFKAGDYVSSNIVNAVCSSKKTVVLLTKALLDSYWCGYEIEMAKLEGLHTGRPVLIFIFLEEIPRRRLSRNLLYNIKNNTYSEFISPISDPDRIKMWWDKLANDIQK